MSLTPYQRTILAAIDAETPEDPESFATGALIPKNLVYIGMNCRDMAEREHVDRQLQELATMGLVVRRGRGVELTLDGQVAAALQQDATACNAPVAAPEPVPGTTEERPDDSHPGEPIEDQPEPVPTGLEAMVVNSTRADGTIDPELRELLIDLGSMVAMRIAEIRAQERLGPADVDELARMRRLAQGVLKHAKKVEEAA